MENKLIAIVTTVYNDNKYINKLLESLLNQNCHNFKHYIYDDGSTEPCDKIVKEYYKKRDEQNAIFEIEYIKSDLNLGVNKAHENVFKIVKEEYFCWVDADDWVDKSFIKTIVHAIRKNRSIDIFHINSKQYNTNYKLINNSTMRKLSLNVRRSIDQFPAYCLGGQRFFHNFVIKRKTFLSINPDCTIYDFKKENNMWYDSQILFQLCLSHSKYKLIKKPISFILNRENSVSRKKPNYNSYLNDNMTQCCSFIIKNLLFSKKDIDLFYLLLPLSNQYIQYLSPEAIDNNYESAKNFYKKYKKIVKSLDLKSNYFNLRSDTRFLLFRKKIEYIVFVRRKILDFLNKK